MPAQSPPLPPPLLRPRRGRVPPRPQIPTPHLQSPARSFPPIPHPKRYPPCHSWLSGRDCVAPLCARRRSSRLAAPPYSKPNLRRSSYQKFQSNTQLGTAILRMHLSRDSDTPADTRLPKFNTVLANVGCPISRAF